jgi:hypothetical protein
MREDLPQISWPEGWSEPMCRAYLRVMHEAGYLMDTEGDWLVMRRPPTDEEEEEAILERAAELLGR